MKKEQIHLLVASGQLRPRQIDRERIKSMVKMAQTNVNIVKKIELNEDTATLIFREMYDSIRQLGDVKWWLSGYEPRNHEVSMELLLESEIKEKLALNQLPRFKMIRNDANYRGFKVTVSQTKDILSFWDKCATEIIAVIEKLTLNTRSEPKK